MTRKPNLKRPASNRILDSIVACSAGAIGMLAQLVWVRVLVQWHGTSATTIATALAASLTGLAIGASIFRQPVRSRFWWQRLTGHRLAAYLLLFAALGAIGGWFLLLAGDWLIGSLGAIVPPTVSLILTAAIALIPLNITLGGVLPALVASTSSRENVTAGTLYAAETVGGAIGALAAGFWLIQNVGLHWTLMGTGVIGAAVAGLAIRWSTSNDRLSDDPQANLNTDAPPPTKHDDSTENEGSNVATAEHHPRTIKAWPMAVAILLAGVASMGLEIVWQRLLILIVGTDTHSYTIVVVTYLIGIAIGAWGGNALQKPKRSESGLSNLFSWLQIFAAISSVIALGVFCEWAAGSGQRWLLSANSEAGVASQRFVLCFALLALPSCIVGASFPAAVRMLMLGNDSSQRSATATVYAIGAAGNILGVLLTGFALIPAYGLQSSFVLLAAVSVAAGVLATQRWDVRLLLTTLVAATVGAVFVMKQSPIGLAELPSEQVVSFYREGPANTVAVVEDRETDLDRPVVRQMVVDGVVIGENVGGVDEKQQLLAHIPLLIKSMSADAGTRRLNTLTIGLGTGILAGELAKQSTVGHVTCVELSPAVIQASEYFSADNYGLSSSTKATILQGDGIHFLRQTNDLFDCIVSDGKSRPGHAGNVAFFSTDYYRLARRRLTESGTFIQWLSLDAPPPELKVVVKSFAQCFDAGSVVIAAPDSIYLVATSAPIRWNFPKVERYLDEATTLHPYHWRRDDDIKSMAWIDVNDVATHLQRNSINSLSRPVLEKFALHYRNTAFNANKIQNLKWLHTLLTDEKGRKTSGQGDANIGELATGRVACGELIEANILELRGDNGWLDSASEHYQKAMDALPNLTRGSRLATKLLATCLPPTDSELVAALTAEEASRQRKLLNIAAKVGHNDVLVQLESGQRLLDAKLVQAATPRFYRATKLAPEDWRAHVGFARCLIKLNKPRAAIRPLRAALQLKPNYAPTHRLLAQVAQAMGDIGLAKQHARLAAELDAAANE